MMEIIESSVQVSRELNHCKVQTSIFTWMSIAHRRMDSFHVEYEEYSDEIQNLKFRTQKWVKQFGLTPDEQTYSRWIQIDCERFAAKTYGKVDLQLLELGAQLISWLFLFDDQYGEAYSLGSYELEKLFSTYIRVLTHGIMPEVSTSFHHALLDIRSRTLSRSHLHWIYRFADSIEDYFNGCMSELYFYSTHQLPSILEYRSFRSRSVGACPVFDLIELGIEGTMREFFFRLPEVQKFRELASLLCAWVNDLFSYPKEVQQKRPLNLVHLLHLEKSINLEEAFNELARIYNEDLNKLQIIKLNLIRSETLLAQEVEYLNRVESWVHGNHAWTATSYRYLESIENDEKLLL